MVKVGNGYYFLYIALTLVYFFALYFLLRKKSKKTQYIVILSLLIMNLALHFIRILFEPFRSNLEHYAHKLTPENLCAVSVFIFPIIFAIKKDNILHDYMFFIGFCSGFAALVYPTEAIGKAPFVFDTIRFYICHATILVAPLLSATLIHKPKFKHFWAMPLLFFAHEFIIFLNEIILVKTGIIKNDLAGFLASDSRNNSFIFGPTPDLKTVGNILNLFVPPFMRQDIFGINGGVGFYFPILWMIGPTYVFFVPIYFILCLPSIIASKAKSRRSVEVPSNKEIA